MLLRLARQLSIARQSATVGGRPAPASSGARPGPHPVLLSATPEDENMGVLPGAGQALAARRSQPHRWTGAHSEPDICQPAGPTQRASRAWSRLLEGRRIEAALFANLESDVPASLCA